MKKRKIVVTLNEARNWFNSGIPPLKEIALQAFSRSELSCEFKNITTFEEACKVLDLNYTNIGYIVKNIATISKASAAMFKLNIIRKALNLDQDLHFTKNPEDSSIYYPYNPLIIKDYDYSKDDFNLSEMEIIGNAKIENKEYYVLGGFAYYSNYIGLGSFDSNYNINAAHASVGFLGCASKEIAQHFGKYFGMTITEAKYGDTMNFECYIN